MVFMVAQSQPNQRNLSANMFKSADNDSSLFEKLSVNTALVLRLLPNLKTCVLYIQYQATRSNLQYFVDG